MGERQVVVDCDVIQADGGTRTAAITGAWVALHDCLAWMHHRSMVKHMPLRDHVAAVSCGVVKGDDGARPRLCRGFDGRDGRQFRHHGPGGLVEVQATAENAPFTEEQLGSMLSLARAGIAAARGAAEGRGRQDGLRPHRPAGDRRPDRGRHDHRGSEEHAMLKGIDPLLTPELLSTLRAMGHGDEIAIVDGNFPAASAGPPVIRLGGVPADAVANAVLSVLPLDDFVPEAAWCMAVVGDPDAEPADLRRLPRRARPGTRAREFALHKLERFAFYARAAACFAVVATGERRLYGNIILKKGVVRTN